MSKVAFITGVTGQDGSYLSELLLSKGYEVHGLIRRNSDFTSRRIDHIFFNPKFQTHHGDLTDSSNLYKLLLKIQPDEIYNLGAQSHVGLSFELPEYSSSVDAFGTLRLLSALRDVGLKSKFYQASTSELFGGKPGTEPQNEDTPFSPRSPNGVLFNHESPRRGRTFVTKKITNSVAKIYRGEESVIKLGYLDAARDWGYAKEYVEAMWKMLQQPEPKDYVIGTGRSYTVRQFVEEAFKNINVEIEWRGVGVDETGVCRNTGKTLVVIDPFYYRPNEVEILRADPSRAMTELNWTPQVGFKALVKMMVEYDINHTEYGYPDYNIKHAEYGYSAE
jgi:GDPmannose 4,6-dehydratase